MTRDPNENEGLRQETNYLHFTPDDPRVEAFYFDSFDEAIEYVNRHDWHFESEDWEPSGLFEEQDRVQGQRRGPLGAAHALHGKILEPLTMKLNKNTYEQIRAGLIAVDALVTTINYIKELEQETFNDRSEKWQESDKGSEVQDQLDELESLENDLNDIHGRIDEMFEP